MVDPETIVCSNCGHPKSSWEFYSGQTMCIECHNEYNIARRAALRWRVFNAYGAACACCGETIVGFLALDHVDGGGRQHRIQRGTSEAVYGDVERAGYPSEYQLLCHNCNQAKYAYGICPHQSGLWLRMEQLAERGRTFLFRKVGKRRSRKMKKADR